MLILLGIIVVLCGCLGLWLVVLILWSGWLFVISCCELDLIYYVLLVLCYLVFAWWGWFAGYFPTVCLRLLLATDLDVYGVSFCLLALICFGCFGFVVISYLRTRFS